MPGNSVLNPQDFSLGYLDQYFKAECFTCTFLQETINADYKNDAEVKSKTFTSDWTTDDTFNRDNNLCPHCEVGGYFPSITGDQWELMDGFGNTDWVSGTDPVRIKEDKWSRIDNWGLQ